jgi:hypothetical protein
MAITLKLDEQQVDRIIEAVNALSDNLAKWEGSSAEAIEQGFTALVTVLTGDDPELQERINLNAAKVRNLREKLQTANDNQLKETE